MSRQFLGWVSIHLNSMYIMKNIIILILENEIKNISEPENISILRVYTVVSNATPLSTLNSNRGIFVINKNVCYKDFHFQENEIKSALQL